MRKAIVVAIAVVAISSALLGWRLLRAPTPPGLTIKRPQVSVEEVERDLCQIAKGEKSFLAITGRYASEEELWRQFRNLGPSVRGQYEYCVFVPTASHFVAVAAHFGPLEKPPVVAVTADERLEVCAVVSNWQGRAVISDFLDQAARQRPWGDVPPTYDCQRCN